MVTSALSHVITRAPLRSDKPARARTAARPSQPVLGNNTPAAISGDAQPTMHIGGTAVIAIAIAAVHGRSDSCRVQHSTQGKDRMPAAASHMRTAPVSLDGQ